MTSPRKAEANRRNAKRSTGPKSAAGRRHASLNALKHGLTARTVLLPFEDRGAYERAARQILDHYRPEGAIEECLVELIIAARWRLVRYGRIEDEFVVSSFGPRQDVAAPEPRPNQAQIQLRYIFGDDFGEIAGDGVQPIKAGAESPGNPGADRAVEVATEDVRRMRKCLTQQHTLLNAYVSPTSTAPMNEISRQRNRATRELLRNIAALETIQERRRSISTTYAGVDTMISWPSGRRSETRLYKPAAK